LAGASAPHEPGSDAAHAALWATPGVTLELTHKCEPLALSRPVCLCSPLPFLSWGTEAQPDFKHHPGNGPGDGFGHLAFAVTNLDEACARLDAAGVPFKKRPSEGRMRTIAFVYDPDGYWVEIVERDDVAGAQAPYFAFAQTMLRCRDPKPSLEFYTQALGMTLVRETHADTFSIYFLATLPTGTQARNTHGCMAGFVPRGWF
jgi:lactoylglutathione lyase